MCCLTKFDHLITIVICVCVCVCLWFFFFFFFFVCLFFSKLNHFSEMFPWANRFANSYDSSSKRPNSLRRCSSKRQKSSFSPTLELKSPIKTIWSEEGQHLKIFLCNSISGSSLANLEPCGGIRFQNQHPFQNSRFHVTQKTKGWALIIWYYQP